MSCGLGAGARCLDLISYYEWNPYEIYASSFNEIFSLDILTKRQIEKLKSFPLEKAQKIYDTVKKNGWKIVTPRSRCYPQALLNLQDLPLVLYVDGNETVLSDELTISIVGSRSASGYSRAVARALASTMAEIGFTVVSGGATYLSLMLFANTFIFLSKLVAAAVICSGFNVSSASSKAVYASAGNFESIGK